MDNYNIKLNEDQLRMINDSLDLYSRVGHLQFKIILEHPTIENLLEKSFTPDKLLEVGDHTTRGEIVEINKDYIKTKGTWDGKPEIKKWDDIKNIKLSPDWAIIHNVKAAIVTMFTGIQ